MSFAVELEAARAAAASAGGVILHLYESFPALANAPADISTEADRAAQECILCQLRERFPTDAFCAEEDTPALAAAPRRGPRLWIIDPIDGTRGFAVKNGEFSVMIALVVEGTIRLGVVLEPVAGRCTWAVSGQGCWRQEEGGAATACRVSPRGPDEAILVRSRSDRKPGQKSRIPAAEEHYTYSAGVKLARIARAAADLYVSTYTGFHAWDICAGQILVDEAGGKVTNIRGRPLSYLQDGGGAIDGVIASNGRLHEHALAGLADRR
jgi:3'(2'), 5'-bisphosphate nucleotidase